MELQNRINEHQELQQLQWEIQEIFIISFRNKYTVEKTQDIIKSLFSMKEDDESYKMFWIKYLNEK